MTPALTTFATTTHAGFWASRSKEVMGRQMVLVARTIPQRLLDASEPCQPAGPWDCVVGLEQAELAAPAPYKQLSWLSRVFGLMSIVMRWWGLAGTSEPIVEPWR
jgi:hypothetical protein